MFTSRSSGGWPGRPIYFAAVLTFLQELIDENRPIGRPPILYQHGTPHPLLKYRQTFDPCCPPFYRGAKCAKFWPKFRPQSSSDRRIFELGHFIGKQKQTCQGSMIGLPPYQTWYGWVSPTPRTIGAMGTPHGKSGNFPIYPPFQRPRASTAPPMLYHVLGLYLL